MYCYDKICIRKGTYICLIVEAIHHCVLPTEHAISEIVYK